MCDDMQYVVRDVTKRPCALVLITLELSGWGDLLATLNLFFYCLFKSGNKIEKYFV